eukprot:GILJ01007841.1.p1 GENE.GILJ01007841.1~~GILJ01007841.1.p1  ORF type:complete len:597 (-),score=122.71 GILJ01007841.1:224-2014(-)
MSHLYEDQPREEYALPILYSYHPKQAKSTRKIEFEKVLSKVFHKKNRDPSVNDLLSQMSQTRARASESLGAVPGSSANVEEAIKSTQMYLSLLEGLVKDFTPSLSEKEKRKLEKKKRLADKEKLKSGEEEKTDKDKEKAKDNKKNKNTKDKKDKTTDQDKAADEPGRTVVTTTVSNGTTAATNRPMDPLVDLLTGDSLIDFTAPVITTQNPQASHQFPRLVEPLQAPALRGVGTGGTGTSLEVTEVVSTTGDAMPDLFSLEPAKPSGPLTTLRFSMSFTWSDLLAIDGRKMKNPDAVFEVFSVLMSLGLHLMRYGSEAVNKMATVTSETEEEKLTKEVYSCFLHAAGVFQAMCSETLQALLKTDLANFSGATEIADARHASYMLSMFQQQCIASAQEMTVRRSLRKRQGSVGLIAKLAMDTSQRYNKALTDAENIGAKIMNKWKQYLSFKSSMYEAFAFYLWGCHLAEQNAAEENAEAIACMQHSAALFSGVQPKVKSFFNKVRVPGRQKFKTELPATLEKVEKRVEPMLKDNDRVYHCRIPEIGQIKNQLMAKSLAEPIKFELPPVSEKWSAGVYASVNPKKVDRGLHKHKCNIL